MLQSDFLSFLAELSLKMVKRSEAAACCRSSLLFGHSINRLDMQFFSIKLLRLIFFLEGYSFLFMPN